MSQFVKKVLPKADADAYAKAKFAVQAHNQSAKAWWEAILHIKDNEWYLADCATWQEWCEKFSKWTPGTIRDAMHKARVSEGEKLITATTGEAIIKDSKVVRVSNYTAGDRQLIEPDKNIKNVLTRKYEAVKPAKAAPVEDENGTVIPESLIPTWLRRAEVQTLMSRVSDLKVDIETLRKSGEKPFNKIDQMVYEKLASVYQMLKEAKPYVVCGACQGRLEVHNGFCKCCASTGFMNEREYMLLVPEESRNIRKKEVEQRKSNEASRLSDPGQRQRAH